MLMTAIRGWQENRGLHVYEHIADRPYGIRLFQLLDPDENVIVIFSWSRDVMEYQHGWQPTVPGMFRGEYRAVAYVDVADYEQSLAFYRDILRLRACYTWDYGTKDRGHKFVIGSGDGTLGGTLQKGSDAAGERDADV